MLQRSSASQDAWLAQALAEHRELMLKRAAAIVRNPADAEDCVQEALERAWRSRDRFIAGSKAAPWLLKITQNIAFNFLRGNAVERVPLDEAAPLPTEGGAEAGAIKREASRSIVSAIRTLAPAHRAAFVMHDVQGFSAREISIEVHLSYATVRTHLHRARRRLRLALAEAAA